jgi:hypothetical protein
MVRIRQRWSFVLLGIVLGVGLVACKKDSTGAAGDQSSEASGGPGGGDLALLPADSEAVVGVNLASMQQSALWASLVQPKLAASPVLKGVADVKARCGYDLMGLKSIVAGAKISADKPNGVVVAHGVDKAKAWDCLEKSKDDITKNGVEMTRDGDTALFVGKSGTAALSFVNSSTAILVIGDKANAAGVKSVVAGSSSLKDAAPFLDMYKKVKTSDTFWGLAFGRAMDELPLNLKATAMYGSINVTDGLAFDVRARFATAADATQTGNMANAQVKQFAQYLDKSEVTTDGSDLHAAIAVSGQKLTQLMQMLSMFAGGIPGMGGN